MTDGVEELGDGVLLPVLHQPVPAPAPRVLLQEPTQLPGWLVTSLFLLLAETSNKSAMLYIILLNVEVLYLLYSCKK